MGFDFELYDSRGESVESLYLSYNFSRYSEYWYVKEVHGNKTSEEIPRLRDVIQRLKSEGAVARIVDGADAWTDTKDVFLCHLERFLKTFEAHPDTIIVLEGDTDGIDFSVLGNGNPDCESSDSDSENDVVTWYRHPTKGNFRVDSFESASEVYVTELLRGSSRAPVWLELCRSFELCCKN